MVLTAEDIRAYQENFNNPAYVKKAWEAVGKMLADKFFDELLKEAKENK